MKSSMMLGKRRFLLLAATVSLAACGSSSSSSPIKLNELLALNAAGSDWLELYNDSDGEVSLAGIQLRDGSNYWSFTNGTLAARAFLQVICDGSGKDSKASFKLNAKGEQLSVHDTNGGLIDRVIFSQQREGASWGRNPDGTGSWAFMTPSPGKANVQGAPADGGVLPDTGTPDQGTVKKDSGEKHDGTMTYKDSGKKPDSGPAKDLAALDSVAMPDSVAGE